jgi:hypothetical protein
MRSIERVLQAHIAIFGTFAVPFALSKNRITRDAWARWPGGRLGRITRLNL